jgi:REP element-mobilizing transposase RayT
MRQLAIEFRTWGGKRKGAGRKRTGRKRVPHVRRAGFSRHHPLHVTLRFVDGLPTMRRRETFRAIRAAMYRVMPREDFRVLHLSLQRNHVHLVCEANDRFALARGVQAFKISAAKRLNLVLGRSGAIFADRYHVDVIETPTQMRAAYAYVLCNWRKHGEDRGADVRVDHFSTGYFFAGWRERGPLALEAADAAELLPARAARTWLAREGWRKAGTISLYERPGPR